MSTNTRSVKDFLGETRVESRNNSKVDIVLVCQGPHTEYKGPGAMVLEGGIGHKGVEGRA